MEPGDRAKDSALVDDLPFGCHCRRLHCPGGVWERLPGLELFQSGDCCGWNDSSRPGMDLCPNGSYCCPGTAGRNLPDPEEERSIRKAAMHLQSRSTAAYLLQKSGAGRNLHRWHLLGESNPQLTLRSSPQSDMRESNQYKKVLILSDFSEVSLSIQDKP